MGLSKRWLENKIEWLNRVMQLSGVDFAIATEKTNSLEPRMKPPQQWLVFTEISRAHRYNVTIGMHKIGRGPEIGRMIPKTNEDVEQYDWVFHTRDRGTAQRIKGLVWSDDVMGDRVMFEALQSCTRHLKKHEGIHIYTTPDGEKWYAKNECFVNGQIRLYTRRSVKDVGKYGWFLWSLMDQYGGTWELHRFTLNSKEVIDQTMETSEQTGKAIPKALKDLYRLEEKEEDESILVLIPQDCDGLSQKKSYRLTLDLRGMVKGNQVLNIEVLLTKIITTEFPSQYPHVNLDRIKFLIEDDKPIMGLSMLAKYGNQYYYRKPQGNSRYSVKEESYFPRNYY